MPFMHNVDFEPRGLRTMRIAIIAGAAGALIGGAVVIASVATILSVTDPQPKQTALAAKGRPLAETTGVATPGDKIATAADTNGCADQTWPNIETRCLTRVDDADRQTTPVNDVPATATGIAPSALQPGSPAVPAPPALLQSQSIAATPQQPQPAAQPQAVAPPDPAVENPAKPKPIRKAERPRHPPQVIARQTDDGDDLPAVAVTRRAGPRAALEETGDVVAERPRRSLSPLGLFGALFGADNE